MRQGFGRLKVGGMGIVLGCGLLSAAEPDPRPFTKKHCVACHEGPDAAGGLDFAALKEVAEPKSAALWTRIYERVRRGEMPPPEEEAPSPAARNAFLDGLSARFAAAGAERLRTQGRGAVRRLNRIEYENTLHDLLGIDTELAPLLPEDESAAGFDTVGEGLTISPVLLEGYLAAADVALNAAAARGPRPETKVRRIEYKTTQGIASSFKGGNHIAETPDAAVLYNDTGYTPYDPRELWGTPPGRYKVRLSTYAHKSAKPVTFRVYIGNFFPDSAKNRLAGVFDAPPGEGAIVEFETSFVGTHDSLKAIPCDCGPIWAKAGEINNHPGPGLALRWIELEGPLHAEWPPRGHVLLYGSEPFPAVQRGGPPRPKPPQASRGDFEKILNVFLPKAFRRPVTTAELNRFVAIAEKQHAAGESFEQALRSAERAILCSPHFLFLNRGPAGPLDGPNLAARLSYFLWSSCPDETLAAKANDGTLLTPAGLRAETERMLADPKAARFTQNFCGQWLGLRNLDFTTPDPRLYPEYDAWLRASMEQETHRFFAEILRSDRSVTEFVRSDWAMLDGRLARHYGIPGVEGAEFRRVKLPADSPRGGLPTQASILKVTANGTTTSPVIRGAWVMDKLLGSPLPPPPPNVPAVEPDIRGATTIRELLEKHRSDAACASCHRRMDPPGFALESFDVIGGFRERYRAPTGIGPRPETQILKVGLEAKRVFLGPPVDPADALPDGRRFADLRELQRHLLTDPERIAVGLAEKLLAYGTGEPAGPADRPDVRRIVAAAAAKNHGFRTLLYATIASTAFREK